ncbi:MAG: DUF4919 domain-containing protein [Prevotella sp.]|nr:DUF4919 domain-containing protein [Prevotella sp.]MCM1075503.1 DUF4919 domain-containing protein [Ruminococcus sp.]
MKHTVFTIIALLIMVLTPASGFAQKKLKVEAPDLERIREATLDPESPFYYAKLQKLYDANDTVMTPEQYRYFYFGSMYQEDYNPYRKSDYTDHTDSLLNLNRQALQQRDSTMRAHEKRNVGTYELNRLYKEIQTHTIREQKEIIKNAELALKDNPFDIQSMYMLSRLLQDMDKKNSARIWDYRLENLLGAIISSGFGKSQADPFIVVSPDHEYFLLEVLGYDVDDYEFIEPGFDYLKVHPTDTSRTPSSKTPAGFYFNVQPLIEQYNLKYPENSEEVTATGTEIELK